MTYCSIDSVRQQLAFRCSAPPNTSPEVVVPNQCGETIPGLLARTYCPGEEGGGGMEVPNRTTSVRITEVLPVSVLNTSRVGMRLQPAAMGIAEAGVNKGL